MKRPTIHVSRICRAYMVHTQLSAVVVTTYLHTVDEVYHRWSILHMKYNEDKVYYRWGIP